MSAGVVVHGRGARRGPNRDGTFTVVCLCGQSWRTSDLGLGAAWDALDGHLADVGVLLPAPDRFEDGLVLAGLMRAGGAGGDVQLVALRDSWLGRRGG